MNEVISITYEGVSWNCLSVIADGLAEEQFIKQGLLEGQYRQFNTEDQKKLLKEAYRLIKLMVKQSV